MAFDKQIYRDQQIGSRGVYIGSVARPWEACGTTVSTADNSGSRVVSVTAIIATTARVHVVSFGTSLILRCKYATGTTTTTSPVIQVVGIDQDDNFHFLLNGASTPTDEITLTIDATNDILGSGYRYSAITADTTLDLQGCSKFCIVVKTAAVLHSPSIQYKVV